MADYFVEAHQVPQVEVWAGVLRRTLGTTDEAMLCEFSLQQGAFVPPHHHMNDQVGYVLRGKVEMTIGGDARILHPGESYAIPGGVIHSARALEDATVIDVFSPPRNDYRTEAR